MKKLFYLLFLMTTLSFSSNPTPTTISDVTVYLSGAQVTRTATIKLPVGTTEFTFDKLSPYIQEASIQVSGLKSASILSINFGINYLSKQNQTESVEAFQDQIKSFLDKIQMEDDLIAGFNEELSVIQSNRHLGNDSQVVNLEKLKQFTDYYRTRITEIKSSIYASEKKKHSFQKEISDIQKQLAELNVNDKVQTGEIKIKLNASTATTLDIIIKYNVINAGWFPIYDLKADKINAPLQLAYKAHVYQSTGNKWENVKLTLSTSDPNTNNLKPEVNTKYLNFISHNTYYNNNATKSYNYKYNPMVQTVSGIVTANDGSPLPGVNVIEKGTTNGVQTDFDGNYTLKISTGNELVYSFIGMKSESLPIHSSIMNVSLDEDVAMLDEVVVMAYGSQKRTAMTSSATEVKSESIDRLLQGKVAGVQIRGMANIKSKDNPLYVVDGNILNGYEVGNLNPDDIMSVDILKDATSAALYGNRANNGVVVITTKKGEYTSKGDVIEQGITNTRFEIKKPYTIPSDGDVTVIEIENYSVPATYAYFAAPVLNENVFLTAKIGNWEQYNLLPAEANVYFEGSYSGKTNINPMATTDSLTVSLGVDPNVVIKRTELNDFKKNQYIGSNKIINKKYELELKNNKQTNIDLVLFDRIPISQNRDIKVEDIETGNANYDSEKGIMEWKVNLKPNDKSTYSFSYSIKYPKYKRVNL